MFDCDRDRFRLQLEARIDRNRRRRWPAQTVWEEPMGSESGISMIPTVKPGHPHRSTRRQHRLAILKGT
jgi:hypothetical protein